MELYYVQYQYFDKNGAQKTKVIEKNSLKKLISAMDKHLKNVKLYEISHVSNNLYDYDFSKHGKHFECSNKR